MAAVKEEIKDSGKESASAGVKVPEEFQRKVFELIKSATRAELAYLRDCVYQKEEEIRKSEMKSTEGGKTPSEYSLSDVPKD